MSEPAPREQYEHLTGRLAGLGLAYLHVVHNGDDETVLAMRATWPHAMLVNRPRADLKSRLADVDTGLADAISVGALHIANPDLATRLRSGAELNAPDPTTFYGGDSHGYTDYPTL